MGMEFRPYYFAREWIKMGHRVDIIAANFSHLRRLNPQVDHDFQKEVIDEIHYHWIKTGTYEGNGAKRAMTMFQFVSKLWIHAKSIIAEMEPDVVIASSTYPLDTYVGQRIRKLSKKNVKLIHEVHDMWPATLYEVGGMSKRNPFVTILQLAENSAYGKSNYVVSLLPLAKNYMVEHGLKPEKFIPIANGIVLEDWENMEDLPEEHSAVLKRLNEQNKFVVGYFGGHAISNALDVLVSCAMESKDQSIAFVLVGDGVEKSRLQSEAKALHLNNIYFLPPVSKKVVPSLCKNFNCSYIGAKDSPLYRFGLCMNKIFDTMMAGVPAVCAITTPTSPFKEFDCGIMVESEDVSGILAAINKIKTMSKNEYNAMGQRGKQAAIDYFDTKKLAAKFANLF